MPATTTKVQVFQTTDDGPGAKVPITIDQYDMEILNKKTGAVIISVRILSWGATVTHLRVPDKNGALQDVVLGFDDPQQYLSHASTLNPFFGAVVGRTASRIANAQFTLDNHLSNLSVSNGVDCSHGGKVGFDKQNWVLESLADDADSTTTSLILSLISPAGQNGYPGRLKTTVRYTITDLGELVVDFHAELISRGSEFDDQDLQSTIVSVTNHSYFNLDGVLNPVLVVPSAAAADQHHQGGNGGKEGDNKTQVVTIHASALDHHLWLNSSNLIVLGKNHPVPTGEIKSVTNSFLDFTNLHGHSLRSGNDEKENNGYGYDYVYQLSDPNTNNNNNNNNNKNGPPAAAVTAVGQKKIEPSKIGIQAFFDESIQDDIKRLPHVAWLSSLVSGIRMDLYTTEPSLVLYGSGYLDSKLLQDSKTFQKPGTGTGTGGDGMIYKASYDKFSAMCLEPIRYPDAIHHQDWKGMVVLRKGQVYRQNTVYKFGLVPKEF